MRKWERREKPVFPSSRLLHHWLTNGAVQFPSETVEELLVLTSTKRFIVCAATQDQHVWQFAPFRNLSIFLKSWNAMNKSANKCFTGVEFSTSLRWVSYDWLTQRRGWHTGVTVQRIAELAPSTTHWCLALRMCWNDTPTCHPGVTVWWEHILK